MRPALQCLCVFLAVCLFHTSTATADLPPTFILNWGTQGSGPGQLQYPQAIDVDSAGNVYVVDYQNDRVQKFDKNGVYMTHWGSFGSGDGQFSSPYGLAVSPLNGQVYVSESSNNRVQRFSQTGTFIGKWGTAGGGDGQFNVPIALAVDDSGYVYVADYSNNRVQKFDSAGVFVTKWGSGGQGDGQFSGPRGVTVSPSGFIYVTESGNSRVQKFDSDGTFLTKWGSLGLGDGQFNGPTGIAVDENFNVYVAESLNDRIQKFDSAGVFLTKWGAPGGSGDGQLNGPADVTIDGKMIYVSDRWNHRVQKFGYVPKIVVSDTVLAYGSVLVGQIAQDTLTIDNLGSDTLTVQISVGLSQYTPSLTSAVIAPGASELLTVDFAPDSVKTYVDSLLIASNDPYADSTVVRLDGIGALPDLLMAAFHAPIELTAGYESMQVSFVLQNVGGIAAPPFDVSIRASSDSNVTAADALLATVPYASLDTAAVDSVNISVTMPWDAPRGDIYLGAVADDSDAVPELDDSNNVATKPFSYQVPLIHAVRDIPGDQGGMVYLSWYASPLDLPAAGGLITQYSIWRAISAEAAQAALEGGNARILEAGEPLPNKVNGLLRVERIAGQTFFWHPIDTTGAHHLEAYGYPEPTLFDSTASSWENHYFQVIAHTDSALVFYISAPDSGYSVDNLAPAQPQSLVGEQTVQPDGLRLAWDPNTEDDLSRYVIHRGTQADFVPDGQSLVGEVSDTTFLDAEWRWDSTYFYKVAAVDIHDNVSPYASLDTSVVVGIGDGHKPLIPRSFALYQNVPNPFNPTTVLRYDVPGKGGVVTLRVYDVTGRIVRTLVDGRKPGGRHAATWTGRDDRGNRVATGVYFYRLEAPGFVATRKMVLLQ